MPRQVEVAGEDDVSVPVAVLEEVHVPAEVKPEPQEQPLSSLRILSTLPLAAAPRTRVGVAAGLDGPFVRFARIRHRRRRR